MNRETQIKIFDKSILIADEATCAAAIDKMAAEMRTRLRNSYPLFIAVMNGAFVFAANLIVRLQFPMEFDTVIARRYQDKIVGQPLDWVKKPPQSVKGRTVVLLDDILDEGVTLKAAKEEILAAGATACLSAVFVEKDRKVPNRMEPDFIGVKAPNLFLFGYGMDVRGAWRNLPCVRAIPKEREAEALETL